MNCNPTDAGSLLKRFRYAFGLRTEMEPYLPPGLTERMAEFDGKYIIYDPADDDQGFCLTGDDIEAMLEEAVEFLGLADEE